MTDAAAGNDATLEAVRTLLAICCNALSVLCDEKKSGCARYSARVIHNLIQPLEALGITLAESKSQLAFSVLDAAYALHSEACAAEGDHAGIIEYARKGMSAVPPTEPGYYLHVGSAAQAHCASGQLREAVQLITTGIQYALSNEREELIFGLIRFLTDEQLASSSEDEFFLDAISAYAERALERDRVEFKLMWKTNPKLAFSELFGSDLQR